MLYSPLTSLKGATLAVTRVPRTRAPDAYSSSTDLDRPIIAPHSLPMFKDDDGAGRTGKRKRERERHDPQKTMKPSEWRLATTFLHFNSVTMRLIFSNASSATRRRSWTRRPGRRVSHAACRPGSRARQHARPRCEFRIHSRCYFTLLSNELTRFRFHAAT